MQSNIVFCQEQAGLGRDGEFFSYFIWQDNDEVWIDSQFYGFHHLLGPSVARWRRRCEEREGEWYQRRAHQKEETCELFIVWNWKHGGGPSTRRGSCPCANCCRPPTVVGSGPVHGSVHSPSFRTPPGVGVVDHSKKTGTHKNQHSQGLPQTLGGGPVYGSSTASSSTTNSPRTSARNRFRFSVGSSPHSASTVNVLKPTFRLLRENQCAVLNFAGCPTALPQNVRSQRKIGTDPDVPRIWKGVDKFPSSDE